MVAKGARGILTQVAAAEDAGRFAHTRYAPSAVLAPFVEHYWAVTWDLRGRAPQRMETLPHPSVHMIFEPNGRSRIAGVARGKFVRMLEGKSGVFGVKFKPGGFHPFVSTPISSFTDRTVSLGDVFGADGVGLDDALMAESDDTRRVRVVETFLVGRELAPDANVARVAEMVYAVAREPGFLKVEDLVACYGVNKRTLQRLFAKYVGVSPKWVIQRYRLHEAAAQLASGDPINHATLAATLGYSDQVHFVNDFKATVGTSPAAYAEAVRTPRR